MIEVGGNSLLTLEDARIMAASYVITLPSDDTEAETAIIQGAFYLETYEDRLSGERSNMAQTLVYPRNGSTVRGVAVTETPNEAKLAQLLAAEQFGKGVDMWGGVDNGKAVASEAVAGAVSVSYFNNGKTGSAVTVPRLERTMAALFGSTGGTGSFAVLRG